MGEQRPLVLGSHRVHALGHSLGRRVARCHFYQHRRVQEAAGQLADSIGERGGKQQVLTPRRQQREEAANIADETHVQHTVCLVQHQDFHLRQIHGPLPHVVQQPPRSGHQDIHTQAQRFDLGIHADAAVGERGAQGEVFSVAAHALFHLGRKLAGGGEDQRTHGMAGGRSRSVGRGRQALEQGKRKASGLAGAGLGGGEHIVPFEDDRNGSRLDRRGFRVALFLDRPDQLVLQAESCK